MVIRNKPVTEFHSEFFADLKRKHTEPTSCPVFGLKSADVKAASINSTFNESFEFDADEVW
jgi:hypothetical protein